MTRELFDQAYRDHSWGGSSPSGPGSSLSYTESIRASLPSLLQVLGCKSLLDAPCGDTNWIGQINLSGISYIGYDISQSLIAALKENHPNSSFEYADITQDFMPQVDFWLCRDVLFHISNSDIYRVIFNFLRSGSRYFGTTHHAQCTNTADCLSSPDSWRQVNLTAPPFHLPMPIYTLWDSADGFVPRWLGVWSRQQIVSWLHHMQGVTDAAAAFSRSPQNGSPSRSNLRQTLGELPVTSSFAVTRAYDLDGSARKSGSPKDHGLYEFDMHGAKFNMLSLGDCQVTMAYLSGGIEGFEPFSLKIWSALAEKANFVLDIGAYTGIYSLVAATKNRQAKIVAFEASQTTFGRLLTNILLNRADGQICPVHKAASHRSGHLDLALSGGIYTMASGESLEESAQVTAWARKRVETISVDEIIIDWDRFHPSDLTLSLPAEGVSLIKIDVEGHEKSTLAGMRRVIERDHPTILVEILEPSHLPDIVAMLDGYEGYWIGESGIISTEHVSGGLNALLIHKLSTDLKQHISTAVGVECWSMR